MEHSDFKNCCEIVKKLAKVPTNAEKLQLYGLYKQATEGDNTNSAPWAIQVEARAKWDAWNLNRGKTNEDSMNEYIVLVNKLIKLYGTSD